MKRNGVVIKKSNVKAILQSLSGDRLGRAVMAGGFVLETAAKMKTPVDTGNLVNSITTELTSSDDASAYAQVGTGAEYAEPVEYGHITTGGTNVPAQPYMRPALDETSETIKATIARFAKMQIEGAAK